jgi:Trk K+ transport system NAD-binding subunit
MQIILSGVIMIFIVVPLLVAPFIIARLAPTPPKTTPHPLSGHTVVFGFDEIAKSIVDSLTIADHDIVIIEMDKTAAFNIAAQYRKRAYVIWGDYTDPASWAGAYLEAADYIVICKDERLTANIVLGIRELAKGKIISIVDKLSFDRYLRYAGAEYVLSPKHSTGRILARHAVLNPAGDTAPEIPGLDRISINLENHAHDELKLINIPVAPGAKASGKTLRELQLFERYGIIVLFLWRSGTFVPKPCANDEIDTSTSLFLFGRTDAIVAAIHDEFSVDGQREARAVIAGFGDVGAAAYQELRNAGISCIVVDSKKHDVNQVVGNAENEEILKNAHIEDAQFCIVALNNDDVNIFTTLMARNLNPAIRILARANTPVSVDKLYRAGADYVALLPMIGGQTIGRIILSDLVTILLELPNGEIVVMKHVMNSNPGPVGRYKKKTGVQIIGIESASRTIVAPSDSEVLKEGDAVVAVGDTDQLRDFIRSV